jgi:hypothetical protein
MPRKKKNEVVQKPPASYVVFDNDGNYQYARKMTEEEIIHEHKQNVSFNKRREDDYSDPVSIFVGTSLCDSKRLWAQKSMTEMAPEHFQALEEMSLITAGFSRRGVTSLEDLITADTSWIVPRTCRILIESSQKDLIIQQLKNKISNIQTKNKKKKRKKSMELAAGMRACPEDDQEDHWMYGFTGQYFVSDDVMDSDKMLKSEECSGCRSAGRAKRAKRSARPKRPRNNP